MSLASVLVAGRAAAEALMVDACTITRTTVTGTDRTTGEQTTETATIYTGQCRVQQPGRFARPARVGEAQLYQSPYDLQLPVDTSTGVHLQDVVTIDSSANDPELAGQTFWVKELAHKTHATARRLGLEQVTG